MSLAPELKARLVALRLFDAAWYLEHYRDVQESGMDALGHFISHGLDEGRQPGPAFDPNAYWQANPDVRALGVPALRHYLQSGYKEGRPLTVNEKLSSQQTRSIWPEWPLPGGLPHWYKQHIRPLDDGTVRIMYVLSIQSGGTPQTNQDLMTALGNRLGDNVECFVLRCVETSLTLYLFRDGIYLPIERHQLAKKVPALDHYLDGYDLAVEKWLVYYRINVIHVRHMVWQSLGLMEVAYQSDIPVVYSFHDYYSVCPSVKLLDENNHFCAGRCTPSRGECFQELWPSNEITALKHDAVYRWQQQFAGSLALCRGFVATTEQVRNVMQDIFPALLNKPFKVIPHGRDFNNLTDLAVAPAPNMPLRVVIPGHISRAKGAEVLLQLAADKRLAHVEWHVLGTLDATLIDQAPNSLVVHGPYLRDDFTSLIAQIRPHLGAVLSIWPETWCHTLTELWAAGLPVIGFDTGAVGERLRETQAGWLADDITAESVVLMLLKASEAKEWQQAKRQLTQWQLSGQHSCSYMADNYWNFYQSILKR